MEPVKPLCPYFGECGGCVAQHVPYELQLNNKKDLVLAALRKNNIEVPGEVGVFHGEPYHYRNRMDFIFFQSGLGFRKKGQFDRIVGVNRCEISNERLNSLLAEVRVWFEKNRDALDVFDIRSKRGTLRYALVRASEFASSSAVSFVLNSDSQKQAAHIDLVKSFAESTSADSVVIARVSGRTDISVSDDFFAVKGDVFLEEQLSGAKLCFHSQGFFQNNPAMAQEMVEHCRRILQRHGTEGASLLDLFGGVGTFGVPLAGMFKDCLIVESVPQSIECAKMNIRNNSIKGAEALCLDASAIGKKGFGDRFAGRRLFAITDPPRSGMHPKALKHLVQLSPEVIIYVSCNPQQMAKELKSLSANYALVSLAVFDLFPQTNHVEAVAELRLKK
ncbi:23S rRNA (uracil(1939)-C(5))-methyltransferase RlmD [Candidatus Woesearchaeota archaeon]|nr:23S rRNA (uracil(1939)-C(5))-methyltransferase RlmD [Candidatus Woesearchaeota archaeon]